VTDHYSFYHDPTKGAVFMKKNARMGTRLFFIEFLIVLFFFLIVSTICLQLFARSDQFTRKANALSHAQANASSLAAAAWQMSRAQTTSDLVSGVADCFPEATVQENTLTMTYDKYFESCSPSQAFYTLEADFSAEEIADSVTDADISSLEEIPLLWSVAVTVRDRSGEVLYELTTTIHRPLTREEAEV
jgi:hypothetical protein